MLDILNSIRGWFPFYIDYDLLFIIIILVLLGMFFGIKGIARKISDTRPIIQREAQIVKIRSRIEEFSRTGLFEYRRNNRVGYFVTFRILPGRKRRRLFVPKWDGRRISRGSCAPGGFGVLYTQGLFYHDFVQPQDIEEEKARNQKTESIRLFRDFD